MILVCAEPAEAKGDLSGQLINCSLLYVPHPHRLMNTFVRRNQVRCVPFTHSVTNVEANVFSTVQNDGNAMYEKAVYFVDLHN